MNTEEMIRTPISQWSAKAVAIRWVWALIGMVASGWSVGELFTAYSTQSPGLAVVFVLLGCMCAIVALVCAVMLIMLPVEWLRR